MDLEAMIKALTLKLRSVNNAISAMEALAEHEIQGGRDSREKIRDPKDKPASADPK
jgi:hypothetical protein